jgi:riboflavin kinase/FMN adenylyltransferase
MPRLPDLAAMPVSPLHVFDGAGALPGALRGSVMLLGSFDGLHRGHAALARAARRVAGARPVAALQCDPHPRAYFAGATGFRLSGGEAQRRLLAQAGVDLIYAPRFDARFAATTAEDFVTSHLCRALGVSAVIVGQDFRFGRGRGGDLALLERMGPAAGFEVICPADECDGGVRISSTRIRDDIRAGRVARAVRLMGHPWLLALHRAGPHWGFAADQLLPPDGLYPVETLDGAGGTLGPAVMRIRGRTAQMQAEGPVAMIAIGAVRDLEAKG